MTGRRRSRKAQLALIAEASGPPVIAIARLAGTIVETGLWVLNLVMIEDTLSPPSLVALVKDTGHSARTLRRTDTGWRRFEERISRRIEDGKQKCVCADVRVELFYDDSSPLRPTEIEYYVSFTDGTEMRDKFPNRKSTGLLRSLLEYFFSEQ